MQNRSNLLLNLLSHILCRLCTFLVIGEKYVCDAFSPNSIVKKRQLSLLCWRRGIVAAVALIIWPQNATNGFLNPFVECTYYPFSHAQTNSLLADSFYVLRTLFSTFGHFSHLSFVISTHSKIKTISKFLSVSKYRYMYAYLFSTFCPRFLLNKSPFLGSLI